MICVWIRWWCSWWNQLPHLWSSSFMVSSVSRTPESLLPLSSSAHFLDLGFFDRLLCHLALTPSGNIPVEIHAEVSLLQDLLAYPIFKCICSPLPGLLQSQHGSIVLRQHGGITKVHQLSDELWFLTVHYDWLGILRLGDDLDRLRHNYVERRCTFTLVTIKSTNQFFCQYFP